ncbi:MAG: peptidoglycan-associated lipoprotein Pal [Paracoccaceae bacterium]
MRPALLAAAAAIALAGCTSSPDPDEAGFGADGAFGGATSAATGTGVGARDLPPPNSPAYFNTVIGDRVFFATDATALNPEAERVLTGQAEWLRANPGVSARIEGHADERGTREYNLALGARRAEAVRTYLIAEGVDANRLDTVTFGKERPVSTCSNESCWSENRRGVTVLAGGPVS